MPLVDEIRVPADVGTLVVGEVYLATSKLGLGQVLRVRVGVRVGVRLILGLGLMLGLRLGL